MLVLPQLPTGFPCHSGAVPSAGTVHRSQYSKPGIAWLHACLPSQETRGKGWTSPQPRSFHLCTVGVFLRKTISIFIPWLLLFIISSITDHSRAHLNVLSTVSFCVLSAGVLLSKKPRSIWRYSEGRLAWWDRYHILPNPISLLHFVLLGVLNCSDMISKGPCLLKTVFLIVSVWNNFTPTPTPVWEICLGKYRKSKHGELLLIPPQLCILHVCISVCMCWGMAA